MIKISFFFLMGLFVVLGASEAGAAWKLGSVVDKMSDQKIVFATLQATGLSHGVSATLHLSCVKNIGVVAVAALLSQRMTQGRVAVTFRVDDKPAQTHGSVVGATSQDIPIRGFNAEFLKGAKRFRLQFQTFGAAELFYDFNVSGVDAALKTIDCRRPV
jgi:hypothetical protein